MLRRLLSKPKLFFFSSFTFLILTVFIYFAVCIVTFPTEIYLLAGRENSFSVSPFFSAKIESDAVTATISGDEPVKENISVEPGTEFSLLSDDEAKADMTLSVLGIPVKNVTLDVLPDIEVVPCGVTVGIEIDTTGVLVLGTGAVTDANGVSSRPSDGKVKSGDIILKANGVEIANRVQFRQLIEGLAPGAAVELTVLRGTNETTVFINSVVSREDGKNQIGVWIRDSTKGIGTITYYSPDSRKFGALGHGIIDVDTKQLIPVKNGSLFEANIVTVKKGAKGNPGELVGNVNKSRILGSIYSNTAAGLYGTVSASFPGLPGESAKIALQSEIHEGPAVIVSNVSGHEAKKYDVYIERVNRFTTDDSKGMVIRITDQELIAKTNGIVQGMSGCPIMQDDKLIGAVTHVFVQNPLKGYGIFIENMLKQEKKI